MIYGQNYVLRVKDPKCIDIRKLNPEKSVGIPPDKFNHIHMDLVRPLPHNVDRFSRLPEAYPIQNMSALIVAKMLFVSQYVSRFGLPNTITTYQGSQFKSKLLTELYKDLIR